ncbi:class I SAM-dependent methyltransferase [Mycetocola reblochoni]|uniref:Methyltransferase domain-containing protein n=2 Tax=Mycetocola reblochoni TaxID=331618 RepID=A0A1R4JDF1_9MICO|nr:class I SAM-dependent methyltransferase [Mycetocola reblochoni]RLP69937.1 class I SAM-dependent methyltransferase [Mycetocola reblochoni]SJN30048.1 hypothetical protein FM119_06940 [Mycetocola reblochoni REB411]
MSEERYTLGHHDSVLRSHRWRTVQNSAAYLVPFLREGQRILDVGSGPGTISIGLADAVGPRGEVVGIDADPDVVHEARQRAIDREAANVVFHVGDAYATGLPDASVDIVHAHQLLQHLADPVRALVEFARVLTPGGIVAVRDVVYGSASWFPRLDGLEEWMTLYHRLAERNGGDPDAGASLKAWAMEAGLEVQYSGASVWSFASDADREWWGNGWAERLLESDIAVQAIESGLADLDGLRRISAAWRDWATDERGWFAVPHGELIARRRP